MVVTGMFFRLVEMGAQRFLGHLLQIGVDRGVNAEAFVHRAVPADRRDHLLPDVIDRVGLPLRALPVADHDSLPPAPLAHFSRVDETEIAHPVENDSCARRASHPDRSRAKVCSGS